jgi:hypothetical protein
MVVIVVDPEVGPVPGNLKAIGFKLDQPERCPHLQGDEPGSYSCAIHHYPWFKDTPCGTHGQIEQNPNDPCRIGAYLTKK